MKARSQSSSTPKKPFEPRESWTCERCLEELRKLGTQRNVDGMARYGIVAKVVYGVSKPKMDELARRIGKNHLLALAQYKKVLPLLVREANDDRNCVRKAVNWALRNIGKRNLNLNRAAIQTAQRIRRLDSRSARWIAADASRELKSDAVQSRLRRKKV